MIKSTLPMNLITAKLSQNVSSLRDQLKAVSNEAVTGRYDDLTSHLSGRIGTAMLSQKAVDDIGHERGLLNLRETRLDVAQNTLSRVQEGLGDLSSRMQDALGFGDTREKATIAADAQLKLQSGLTMLNARHGQRYLFSGDATSTPPFAGPDQLLGDLEALAIGSSDAADFETKLDDYFNDPAGGWQTSVYQGTATSSDPEGVVASDPAIADTIRNLAVLALSAPGGALDGLTDADTARQSAAEHLKSSEAQLIDLRSVVGINQKRVADQKSQLDVEETILTDSFNDLTARDQYEAAAELKILQQNLEASYLLTARLSDLSLLNYLR